MGAATQDGAGALREHIRAALDAKRAGTGAEDYYGLVRALEQAREGALARKDPVQESLLTHLAQLLRDCVSQIHERPHAALLEQLYTVPLWDCCEELRTAILDFMVHLVAANPPVAQQTLQVLVHGLGLPRELAAQQPDAPGGEWQPSARVLAVQSDVIAALSKVLRLVPASARLLVPVLARGLPNRLLPAAQQCAYLRALLAVAELPEAAAFRDTLLAAVVQHLVALDVEIRWQDIAAALEEGESEDESEGSDGEPEADIFELDGQEQQQQQQLGQLQLGPPDAAGAARQQGQLAPERLTGRGGFEGGAQDADAAAAAAAAAAADAPSTSGRPEADAAAEKLDALMGLVFAHLRARVRAGQGAAALRALLDAFFATVLRTHRSKFTQFLLWYLLDQDPEHGSRLFLSRLLALLADARQPAIDRSAAAAYAASFLARAAFLPEHLLLEQLEALAAWCLRYCTSVQRQQQTAASVRLQTGGRQPQGVQHQVFYAACQGLLYVLCYRLEQLAAGGPASPNAAALQRLFGQTLPALLHSRLAPLRVCLPTVAGEFCRQAGRLSLLDAAPLLPAGPGAARCQRPLEMFFPFDPYLLQRSAAFLDLGRTFLRWRGGQSRPASVAGAEGSEDGSDAEGSGDSGSSSSSLSSSDGEESEEEPDPAAEAEAATPSRPIQVQPVRPDSRAAAARAVAMLAASCSSAGTASPPCPMSWTPAAGAAEGWAAQRPRRPLDVHE